MRRDQIYAALDRKLWPRDQTDLYFYFLLGCLIHLMAAAADGIGNPAAAEELARAGLAYALAIGHRPLTAQLRLCLALIALYANQPRRSHDMAKRGLDHLSEGPRGTQLYLVQARAAARLGDADTARQAIASATGFSDRDYADDLIEIGGEFGFSRASQHFYAGSATADLTEAETDAISELGRAMELYAAGPGRANTTTCSAGQLDAAICVASPVLALPCGQRVAQLAKQLGPVRTALAAPRYLGSVEARDFDQQIEQLCRDAIASKLRDVPAILN